MDFNKNRSDQTFFGVMLIGLALLFLTGWWWPGIMFVIGAALLARGQVEGTPWNENIAALAVLGVGLVFWLGIFSWNWLPLLMIGVGAYMLFGDRIKVSSPPSERRSAPRRRAEDELQARIDRELREDDYNGASERKTKHEDLL
jgi:hypothetical protein